MKKVRLNKNLTLNKRTVSQLDESSLQDVRGGGGTYTCPPHSFLCPCTHNLELCGMLP